MLLALSSKRKIYLSRILLFHMAHKEPAPETIYFDNAATSFPKPHEVTDAMVDYMTRIGGNPGRSGHTLSVDAGEVVFSAREAVAGLFGAANPMRVIFCSNATDALNLAIQGILRDGDHAVTTSMEHNSTIRPLKELEKRNGIAVTIVPCPSGRVDLDVLERSIRPSTKLVVVNHASNAFGTLQPLGEIGRLCKMKNVIMLADCAQSAGIIPLDMNNDSIDILAFSGHKGLYGPTGTGGLVLADGFDHARMRPLKFGGTGSSSESIYQPEFLPDVFESGTLNAAGISGLNTGVRYILSLQDGVPGVQRYKKELSVYFTTRAEKDVKGFMACVPHDLNETGVVSFNIEGMESSEITYQLSDRYRIMCRSGLHCAPLAHRTMGTFPRGTVRFSFSIFNTKEEIDLALHALEEINRKRTCI
jgi:cysteine desulfurase / selenocysteine lyase